MAKKKKQPVQLVTLASKEKTGTLYYVPRNLKKQSGKLTVRKYDNKLRKHVEFVQDKLAKSSAK